MGGFGWLGSLPYTVPPVVASVPTLLDKNGNPAACAANYSPTGLTLSAQPFGYVQVFVNGVLADLRGDRLGDCYFSVDGGTTALALNTLLVGDQLCWNAVLAGYQLQNGVDRVDMCYNA